MSVLLLHVKKNVLPERVWKAPEIGQLTVITEPGHLQQYDADLDVRYVDNARDTEQVRKAALEVLREREIDRVLAPFELGLTVAGYLRSYFGLPGMGYETANAFANKYVAEIVGHYYLPVQPGTITGLTRAEEFKAIPSVLRIDMIRKIGDVIPTLLNSAEAAGHVFFTMRGEHEIPTRIREILDRYVLETDNAPNRIGLRLPVGS